MAVMRESGRRDLAARNDKFCVAAEAALPGVHRIGFDICMKQETVIGGSFVSTMLLHKISTPNN